MIQRFLPRKGGSLSRLRCEWLEQRRLLAASDVHLEIQLASGDAQLVFNGTQQISAYEIDSPHDDLVPAAWRPLSSQGASGWFTLASTSSTIAEGNFSGSLSASLPIDLGSIFRVGGEHDLTFRWTDADNNLFTSSVVYLSQAPDLAISKSHTGSFRQGDANAAFTIQVTNVGSLTTSGEITVTDALPSGLVPTSASGDGWTTQIVGDTVTARRSDALLPNVSFPPLQITVNVAVDAPSSVTNIASVSGGGDTNTSNNTDSDLTAIALAADLALIKSHSGDFHRGDVADQYQIVVRNQGSAPTTGQVIVTDTLPAGLTPTAASGDGWTVEMVGTTVTARRSDILAPNASYPPLRLTVSVAEDAEPSVTNIATVSGGGDRDTSNNSAEDRTIIDSQAADLTLTKSHSGVFRQGDAARQFELVVRNVGSLATAGLVTLSDTLPDGLVPTAATGEGWTIDISGATVTARRSDSLAGSGTYPPLTIMVQVASNAPPSAINTATVSGGNERNTANNTATDTAVIEQAADLTVTKSHTGVFRQGDTAASYSVVVHNRGPGPTVGLVTVVDTLPAGLALVGASGAGWEVQSSGGQLIATRSDALAPDADFPPLVLTVSVAADAGNVTNVVRVSGGGELNTDNNSASDPTPVEPVADLQVVKQHVGSFAQGDSAASYTVVVRNRGLGPTVGTVTLLDALPDGLTVVSAAGDGWLVQIVGASLSASRSDPLAAGADFPSLTVTVRVANDAPLSVTNVVSVSGGGELNTANNSASDATSITPRADLTVVKSHSGTLERGQPAASFSIVVSNVGAGATSGEVTVLDTLPGGLIPLTASGPGWEVQIDGARVIAKRGDTLAPGSAFPALTLEVRVAIDAALSLTNTASIAGGSQINPDNDAASDTVAIVAGTGSISGYAYIDADNDGRRIAPDGRTSISLPNIEMTLLQQDAAGNWNEATGVAPVLTRFDGLYVFQGLAAARYRVRVTVPDALLDGQATPGRVAGAPRGTAGHNWIEVGLQSGEAAVDFNFGMLGLKPRFLGLEWFLSSSTGDAEHVLEVLGPVAPAALRIPPAARAQANFVSRPAPPAPGVFLSRSTSTPDPLAVSAPAPLITGATANALRTDASLTIASRSEPSWADAIWSDASGAAGARMPAAAPSALLAATSLPTALGTRVLKSAVPSRATLPPLAPHAAAAADAVFQTTLSARLDASDALSDRLLGQPTLAPSAVDEALFEPAPTDRLLG